LCSRNYKNISLYSNNPFCHDTTNDNEWVEMKNYERKLDKPLPKKCMNINKNNDTKFTSAVEFELDEDYFSRSDDTNDVTLDNWLHSDKDYDTDDHSTMPILSHDDDSSIESEYSSMSSMSDDSLFTEEIYSDYDTYDPSDDDETYVEKGFSINADDTSYDTMPAEYMTEENQRKIIPMVIGRTTRIVKTKRGRNKTKVKLFKILFDSGATGNLIADYLVGREDKTKISGVTYTTANGNFTTKEACDVTFDMPEFSSRKSVDLTFNVFKNSTNIPYDMIIGTEALDTLGVKLDFENNVCKWDNVKIEMKTNAECFDLVNSHKLYTLFTTVVSDDEPAEVKEASKRVEGILDAVYEKADITNIVNECKHLSIEQRNELFILLKKYEILFDGTLGEWDTTPVSLEIKPGERPFHGKAYPIPHVYEQTLKKEVQRLIDIGVLEKCSDSEWASPTFIIPKKNGTVRFITDLRQVNKKIVRKPFPIPKISDVMQKLEGFQYATALDLNMGYYHIRLDPDAQKICTLILPWGKYKYLRLPMGLSGSPDIFQDRMTNLVGDLEYARAYLDDLLCLTCSTFEDHLEKLDIILNRLNKSGLKVNAQKSVFCTDQIEYLGFYITRDGIKPIDKKVRAILDLDKPKNIRDVRKVLGMIQYYRDLWEKRSHVLAPLSDLVGKYSPNKKNGKKGKRKMTPPKFVWTEECDKAFTQIKKIVSREVMLAYPNFNKKFEIYTDASTKQLGAVITQDNRPIAFYSKKLTKYQQRYTVTDLELLSIVMTLKEFRPILLGQEIIIYTDHKNLESDLAHLTSQMGLRWRLLIEEFGIKIKYIKGETNTVADALSRLDYTPTKSDNSATVEYVFAMTHSDTDLFPLDMRQIAAKQDDDDELKKRMSDKRSKRTYTKRPVNDTEVILENGKVFIPQSLRERMLDWYHTYLVHPGHNRMYLTMNATMTWPGMKKAVEQYCRTCHKCQINKKKTKKYGKLPAKLAETIPWHQVQVDCVGPYTIKQKIGNKIVKRKLRALTIIDPVTSWIEICVIPEDDMSSDKISTLFHDAWLSRYPRPVRVTYDNGSEFKKYFQALCNEYGLNKRPTTVKNPQANGIIERVHQVINNMIRCFELDKLDLDPNDPFGDIIARISWAVRSTYHTTLQASPGQLVFGRDMLFDIDFTADWHQIYERKQQIINKNNLRENKSRIDFEYQIGDRVTKRNDYLKINKKANPANKGVYRVVEVFNNGTVNIRKNNVEETINIRRIDPYFGREDDEENQVGLTPSGMGG